MVLRAEGLCRRFDRRTIGPVDLELAAGDRVALRGANGSGKSTVLRCLAGTLRPSAGRAVVGDAPAGSVAARRRLGVSLAAERAFALRLTGRQNLIVSARLRGATARSARIEVAALEEELELAAIAAARVAECSTGMVQQLAFARALLGDPSVLLLDEPTRSLDPAGCERLWAALDRRPAAALLIATHTEDDARRCQREVRLDA